MTLDRALYTKLLYQRYNSNGNVARMYGMLPMLLTGPWANTMQSRGSS